ncbi:[protein-PII] uridylyltransferase [Persephonella atlantica]|uniref:Bifunctional uridylyltransferase/uridylyl-removing enzyme n=1 Tax=Persephonella atlantica TaxID=2699429 RepID=A0ABS1GJC3_9AQUI|nr:[protein-PII] uridylyltransferase [Persephonella atlantica]MBK3332990.1 [protein-PII] uridylyltransferase [Persephonella atlantica]
MIDKTLKDKDIIVKNYFEKKEQIVQMHRSGASGLETVRALSDLTDETIKQLVKISFPDLSRICIVVLGGYGRRELCFKSDIDISLVFNTDDFESLKEGIEILYYALLDLKVDIGFSPRDIKTFLELSKDDLTVATSLLQGRFIIGNEEIYNDLIKRFKRLIRRKRTAYIDATLRARKMRYQRTGSTIYMMEPHVKEGEGGLRDFHEVFWIARVLDDVPDYRYFVDKNIILEEEYEELIRAYNFLLRLRNEMHLICNKRCDVLVRPLQEEVAKKLGYVEYPYDQEVLRESVEKMMRLYYLYAKSINTITKRILKALTEEEELEIFEPIDAVFSRTTMEIDVFNREKFEKDFRNVLKAFLYYKEYNLDFSSELEFLIRKHEEKLREHREDPEIRKMVQKLFSDPNNLAKTLRKMQDFYVLDDLIPEFGYQRCHFQYDAYHKYTTDAHAIKAVEELESLKKVDHPHRKMMYELFKEIDRVDLLTWAVFLHDIGKGHKTDHCILGAKMAKEIMLRFGYSKRDAQIVSFLVLHHLDMAKISQRRNMNEPKVINDFAKTIKNKELLKMLTVLTWCDANAVGPNIWNDWKNALLWELYEKTSEVLEQKVSYEEIHRRRFEEKKEKLRAILEVEFGKERADFHMGRFSDYYVMSTPIDDILKHLKMEEQLLKTGKPQFYFEKKYGIGFSELLIVLDSKKIKNPLLVVTGIISYMGINILAVYSYMRKDGIVVIDLQISTSSLEVVEDKKFQQFKQLFNQYIKGEITLEQLSKKRNVMFKASVIPPPTFVKVDNEMSEVYTIFDISGEDRVGLLFDIFKVFARYDLYVHIVKVVTQGERIRDAFYVRTKDKRKITDEKLIEEIKEELLNVIKSD